MGMGAAKPGSTVPPQGGKGGVQPTQPQSPYTPIGAQGGKGGVQQPVRPQVPAQGGKAPVPMGGFMGGPGQLPPGVQMPTGLPAPQVQQLAPAQVPAQGG
jgi:hypothetical protein